MDFSYRILRRRRSRNHDSNPFFNCNSFQTHQVGTPTFSLPNLVGHFFLLFTQPSFLDENERKMPTYVRFFYQKGANFHLFVSGLHNKIGAQPKFEFYRPVLTLMDSLYLLMSQGVVNLLILGISCSFMRSIPVSKREGSSTHWFYDQRQKLFFTE